MLVGCRATAISVNGVDSCSQNSKYRYDHNFGVERAILRQSQHTLPRTKGERNALRLGLSGRLQQKIYTMTSTSICWIGESRTFNLCRPKLMELCFDCNRAMSTSICARMFCPSVIALWTDDASLMSEMLITGTGGLVWSFVDSVITVLHSSDGVTKSQGRAAGIRPQSEPSQLASETPIFRNTHYMC
jgi:hypothetical protein